MSSRVLYYGLLSAALFLIGTSSVHAVEYGELVQKDGKWKFKNTEDPVLGSVPGPRRHTLIAPQEFES